MREILKMSGTLTLITVVAAGVLALVNNQTAPKIQAQRRLVIERALSVALPAAKDGIVVPQYEGDEVSYYRGYASKDTTKLVGYAFVAKGVGYSSTIETMVGIDTTGIIQGISILYQLETPGLGAKIEEIRYGENKPWFQRQFVGRKADKLAVDKDGGEIISVTGATISSRAVTNSIREGFIELQEKIGAFSKTRKILPVSMSEQVVK